MFSSFAYVFRTSKFRYIKRKNSNTLVIYIHGIFSSYKQAFEQKNLHTTWNNLNNTYPYSSFDIASFDYGAFDFFNLTSFETPSNNLKVLSSQLNAYTLKYENIILIGHSQGGLLAKTYASIYHKMQNIFLITLHTPHKNKSLLVFRFLQTKKWEERLKYKIPHYFCSNLDDNIVKANSAILTNNNSFYISQNKKNLGHSHLNTTPDKKLLYLIYLKTIYFTNCGLYTLTNKKSLETKKKTIKIYWSNSKQFQNKYKKRDKKLIIEDLWQDKFFGKDRFNRKKITNNTNYFFYGTSINYFIKALLNSKFSNEYNIKIEYIQNNKNKSLKDINNKLCEDIIDKFKNSKERNDNPYFGIMDIFTFKKKNLFGNIDYYENKNIKTFYKNIIKDIYHSSRFDKSITISKFYILFKNIFYSIYYLNKKKFKYAVFYESLNQIFTFYKIKNTSLLTIEIISSKILESDGDLYWLNKDIVLMMKEIDKKITKKRKMQKCINFYNPYLNNKILIKAINKKLISTNELRFYQTYKYMPNIKRKKKNKIFKINFKILFALYP